MSSRQVTEILREIVQQLREHEELLSQLIAVPHPTFPIHTQYLVIEQLLKTNLTLPVQEWVESGQAHAKEAAQEELLSDADRLKLWEGAPQAVLNEMRKQKWGADYTLAEVQTGIDTVETGLLRELNEPALDDEEDDDDSDDGEEQEAQGDIMDVDTSTNPAGAAEPDATPSVPALSLDVLLKFMSTGKDV